MCQTQSIEETIREVIEEFDDLEDMNERYQYIIELGRDLDPLPEEFRKDEREKGNFDLIPP